MKKMVITLIGLLSFNSYAGFTSVTIEDFSAHYQDPKGHASAKQFSPIKESSGPFNFEVYRDGESFTLIHPEGEYYLEKAPPFLMGLKSFDLNDLDFFANKNSGRISIKSLSGSETSSGLSLSNFKVNCMFGKDLGKEELNYLDGCTTNATITLSSFSSAQSRSAKTILEKVVASLYKSLQIQNRGAIGLSNLSVTIKGHNLSLSAKLKGQISAKIKAYGNISLQAEEGRLAIRISKVKASFLNITKKFFQELEPLQTENFQVQKPYIYIYLN